MIFGSSNFFDVESQSDFISPRFFGCIKEDPCNPRIRMMIDDNNLFTPTVLSDVRFIRRTIIKCKDRKCRHDAHDDFGDVRPDFY